MKQKSNQKIKLSNFIFNKVSFYFYLIFYVACLCLEFISAIELANSLTAVSQTNYDLAISKMILALVLFVLGITSKVVSNYFFYNLRYKIRTEIKQLISNKIFSYTSSTYDSMQTGKFVERIKNDPNKWFDCIDKIIIYVLDIIYQFAILIYISILNIWIGLVLFIGLIILFIVDRIRDKIQMRKSEVNLKKNELNTSLITEIVRGEKDIKSLNFEKTISSDLNKSNMDYENSNKNISIVMMNVYTVIEFLSELVTFIALLVSIFLLKNAYISVAIIMYIFTNKSAFKSVSDAFIRVGTSITDARLASKRINELFDDNICKIEHFGTQELLDCKGKISFDNVTFDYNENDKTINVLKGISFEIKPNTTTAFVGRSGSGKTTIINLIPKLIDAKSGSVKIDGIDIQTLSKDSIRNNIALVNQFPYIFDDTIKGNLLLAKPTATDEELWKVLEDSSLKEFVESLPNGINTKVGESGVKLSGGQRQRLSIARALLKNSKIIIFDESTSSLDNFAQFDIQKSIEALSGNRTIIIVAHRLSTIKNADNILFIKDGKLCDSGKFDELFNNNQDFQKMFLVENI